MPQTDFNQQEQLAEARRLRRLEQRRRQRVQIRLVLFVLLVIAVLSAILILRGCRVDRAAVQNPSVSAPSASQIETEPDVTITVAAVGDIMIDDILLAAAQQEDGTYDFSRTFAAVAGQTGSADLTVGNLELNFAGEPYGSARWSAPEALADALAGVGFDVVQTANSASIQNGLSGLQSTIRALNSAGIDHVGTYSDSAAKAENDGVLLKTVSGLRVAILGYTKGLGGLSLPHGAEYAVDLLYEDYATDFDKIASDAILRSVESARALQPDVILALLHWGSESDRTVTASQEKIANLLLENGVDAIIGTHSHIVGPMETRSVTTTDGREKTCFVAYSLGNFYSSMDSSTATNCRDGVILNLSFTKNGETGETALSGVSYTPTYFADHGEAASPRYEILPVRTAITTNLFPELNSTMTDTIAHLRTYTQSDFDSGK